MKELHIFWFVINISFITIFFGAEYLFMPIYIDGHEFIIIFPIGLMDIYEMFNLYESSCVFKWYM